MALVEMENVCNEKQHWLVNNYFPVWYSM